MMMKADGGELEEEGGGSSQTPILYQDLVCLLFTMLRNNYNCTIHIQCEKSSYKRIW